MASCLPSPAAPKHHGIGLIPCSRRGAWRSLVSAPVWGTGGPELNLGAPTRNPLYAEGFCMSVCCTSRSLLQRAEIHARFSEADRNRLWRQSPSSGVVRRTASRRARPDAVNKPIRDPRPRL